MQNLWTLTRKQIQRQILGMSSHPVAVNYQIRLGSLPCRSNGSLPTSFP
eukprot:COSAG06_NODE_67308_length_252_cov_0.679739_2_plen_48_part_01